MGKDAEIIVLMWSFHSTAFTLSVLIIVLQLQNSRKITQTLKIILLSPYIIKVT